MNTSQSTQRVIPMRKEPALRTVHEAGVVLSPERIEEFLDTLEAKGSVEGTIKRYRYNLNLLYTDLPPEKEIRRGTLAQWRESLLERGYAASTVNVSVSAVNSFLAYCGRRELQLMERLEPQADIQPEMTRAEYLRLLSTARALGKRQLYLIIKLFASTGLPVQDLPKVTAAAAESGSIVITQGGERQMLRIPECLRRELLDFVAYTGHRTGPLFVTSEGRPIGRTNVSGSIRKLCSEAQVPEEKGNPRCLRRLCQATRGGIEANISLLVEQAYERLMETEQLSIGWGQDI